MGHQRIVIFICFALTVTSACFGACSLPLTSLVSNPYDLVRADFLEITQKAGLTSKEANVLWRSPDPFSYPKDPILTLELGKFRDLCRKSGRLPRTASGVDVVVNLRAESYYRDRLKLDPTQLQIAKTVPLATMAEVDLSVDEQVWAVEHQLAQAPWSNTSELVAAVTTLRRMAKQGGKILIRPEEEEEVMHCEAPQWNTDTNRWKITIQVLNWESLGTTDIGHELKHAADVLNIVEEIDRRNVRKSSDANEPARKRGISQVDPFLTLYLEERAIKINGDSAEYPYTEALRRLAYWPDAYRNIQNPRSHDFAVARSFLDGLELMKRKEISLEEKNERHSPLGLWETYEDVLNDLWYWDVAHFESLLEDVYLEKIKLIFKEKNVPRLHLYARQRLSEFRRRSGFSEDSDGFSRLIKKELDFYRHGSVLSKKLKRDNYKHVAGKLKKLQGTSFFFKLPSEWKRVISSMNEEELATHIEVVDED